MTPFPGLPPKPGTYILVLRNNAGRQIEAGGLGNIRLSRGWYLYAGSAFGPGGLAARVGRHLRPDKSCRWHIDYLTTALPVHRVWLSTSREKLECRWAGLLGQMGGGIAAEGFGASDCTCPGHLHRFGARPSFNAFRALCPHPVRSVRIR